MPAFAVIDVGTNSVKFHIGERHDDGSWSTVIDRAEVSRLGEGIAETGDIAPAAIERTVEAIAGMAEEARRHDVAGLAAVGTMGMRSAGNSEAFIAAVRERCGVTIEVIPGAEEGRLAYLAVKAGLGLPAGSLVVLDTGGGSTQFTFGRGDAVDEQFSLDIGAVRLTAQYGLGAPLSREQLDDALAAIAGEFSRLDGATPPDALVGMGGAITNMTAIMLRLERVRPRRGAGRGAQPRRGRPPDRTAALARRGCAPRDRRAAAQARRRDPRRCLRGAHGHGQAGTGLPDRE